MLREVERRVGDLVVGYQSSNRSISGLSFCGPTLKGFCRSFKIICRLLRLALLLKRWDFVSVMGGHFAGGDLASEVLWVSEAYMKP